MTQPASSAPLNPSTPAGPRHFLDIRDLTPTELRRILDIGKQVKALQQGRRFPLHPDRPLAGRTLGLMLACPSTRTRVSFEVGMEQLGGAVSVLSTADMQLGRGESIADTARVLSRFLDVIVLRARKDSDLRELARWSSVPVINGLTPVSHPIQILADVMTFEEHRGPIAGRTLAWIGDGNNVATSLIEASALLGFRLRLATPEGFAPSEAALSWARAQGADIVTTRSPAEAVQGADCVITDTWVSMGDEDAQTRHQLFRPYQVNAELMAQAAPDALFMHCLPAHLGEEVTQEVFESPASVVFDEAENRLHSQKGLLLWCLGHDAGA
ncbi:ornithine carbamoyltransferase [Oecophyllibacter saccharovorans]|uniref:Ornithine carbamoyltransferase n=1 Tax=Oecophyllibacter saccharovorans TaxID=2558360 RepID=A0A506UMH1_9PROT|nr:ornithine carbamoyltransferase [Oecophyllibacter saccharovorans]TPW34546.1 ornithine carbamoyltransferase [Oecophyllibacter saccharovorans]